MCLRPKCHVDDGLQVLTVFKNMITERNRPRRDDNRAKASTSKGILPETKNRWRYLHGLQVCTAIEGIYVNLRQSRKIFQFIEGVDKEILSKRVSEVFHSRRLLITQFSVAVGIPMLYTEGFYLRVFKHNILFLQLLDLLVQSMGITVQSLGVLPGIFYLSPQECYRQQ